MMETKTSTAFNTLFFKRFYRQLRIISPKFLSTPTLLFFLILLLVLLEQVTVFFIGIIPSEYLLVLGKRDVRGFWTHTLESLGLVVAMAIILSAKKFSWTCFYIKSRESLTKEMQRAYLKDINFYKINILEDNVDNVDQRISQDVDKMTMIFAEMVPELIITPFNIAVYSYICWNHIGWVGPTSVYIFFIVCTIINKFLMTPVVKQTAKQEQLEGEFRYKHMHLRLNSEPAAFYRCGPTEKVKVEEKLDDLLKCQKKLNLVQFFLSLSVNMANYLGSVLRFVIVGVPIFQGHYDHLSDTELSSFISRSSFVTLFLIFNFTRLINMAPEVSKMAGCSHRLGELMEKLDALQKDDLDVVATDDRHKRPEKGNPAYILKNVHVCNKGDDNKVLVQDLSMQLVCGESVIVTGDSGVGKTSLIRTLDSLWPLHRGRIERRVERGKGGVIFLPQKPYLTNGTLRQQLIFPDLVCQEDITDDHLIMFLHTAGLESLLVKTSGLDTPNNWHWEEILSPGEAQRLAFVRLFYHRPSFAVLDEATSQIGGEVERKLYSRCLQEGITLLSVAHKHELKKYHRKELRLMSGGKYQMNNLMHDDDGVELEDDVGGGDGGEGKVLKMRFRTNKHIKEWKSGMKCQRLRSMSSVMVRDVKNVDVISRFKYFEGSHYDNVLYNDAIGIYYNYDVVLCNPDRFFTAFQKFL